MLVVKTLVLPSSIHGLGLFAAEKITKGTVIWRYAPKFDVMFSDKELEGLPQHTRAWVHMYAYRSKLTGLWCLSVDDARFFNHSVDPNTFDFGDDITGLDIASRNIEAGEEITIDYYTFDADADNKLRP